MHCGVSHLARGLVLEKCAHSKDYCKDDVRGCTPNETNIDCCVRIDTGFDLGKVCAKVNEAHKMKQIKLEAQASTNAGRYALIVITRIRFIHVFVRVTLKERTPTVKAFE